MFPSLDSIHLWLLSWQPDWFKKLPLQWRELPAALYLIPLVFWPLQLGPWSLLVFAVGSETYETVFPGYKAADALWRIYGAIVLYLVSVVIYH